MVNDTQEMKEKIAQDKAIREKKRIVTLNDYERVMISDEDEDNEIE